MISQLALLPRGGWGGQIRKAVLAKPPTTSHFWIWEPYRSEWVGQCCGTVCRLFIPPQQSRWYSPDAADFWDGRWVRWWEMGKSGLQNGGNLSSPVHLAVIEKPFPQEHLESFKDSGIQRGFSRCCFPHNACESLNTGTLPPGDEDRGSFGRGPKSISQLRI